jgi:hypothetical protein
LPKKGFAVVFAHFDVERALGEASKPTGWQLPLKAGPPFEIIRSASVASTIVIGAKTQSFSAQSVDNGLYFANRISPRYSLSLVQSLSASGAANPNPTALFAKALAYLAPPRCRLRPALALPG